MLKQEALRKELTVVILAAGVGSRMMSDVPKAMQIVGNFYLIEHLILKAKKLNPFKISICGFMRELTELRMLNSASNSSHAISTGRKPGFNPVVSKSMTMYLSGIFESSSFWGLTNSLSYRPSTKVTSPPTINSDERIRRSPLSSFNTFQPINVAKTTLDSRSAVT